MGLGAQFALQQLQAADDRSGSKPVSLEVSKCFPVCPRKQTLLGAVGTAEKCHEISFREWLMSVCADDLIE